jgi:hypothetical protein
VVVEQLAAMEEQPSPARVNPAAAEMGRRREISHYKVDGGDHVGLLKLIAKVRPLQLIAVDAIRLGSPGALLHHDARRIEYMVLDPGRSQQPVQPEAIVAGLN